VPCDPPVAGTSRTGGSPPATGSGIAARERRHRRSRRARSAAPDGSNESLLRPPRSKSRTPPRLGSPRSARCRYDRSQRDDPVGGATGTRGAKRRSRPEASLTRRARRHHRSSQSRRRAWKLGRTIRSPEGPRRRRRRPDRSRRQPASAPPPPHRSPHRQPDPSLRRPPSRPSPRSRPGRTAHPPGRQDLADGLVGTAEGARGARSSGRGPAAARRDEQTSADDDGQSTPGAMRLHPNPPRRDLAVLSLSRCRSALGRNLIDSGATRSEITRRTRLANASGVLIVADRSVEASAERPVPFGRRRTCEQDCLLARQ
jgi:hypothetical protein